MHCLGNIKQDLTNIFDDIANKHPQTKTVLHCRFQKQPPEVFCKKAFNFFKNGLHHRCFPVNIVKFLKTPISRNICEQLLLKFRLINDFYLDLETEESEPKI